VVTQTPGPATPAGPADDPLPEAVALAQGAADAGLGERIVCGTGRGGLARCLSYHGCFLMLERRAPEVVRRVTGTIPLARGNAAMPGAHGESVDEGRAGCPSWLRVTD